jgi:hypothetical protein
MTPLIKRIATGKTLMIHPVQVIHFGLGGAEVSDCITRSFTH